MKKFMIPFRSFLLICAWGIFLGICPVRLSAQESILSAYERNFIRASLEAKTRILLDAAYDERAGEFMGSLYEFALQFAAANGEYLSNDQDMISLVAVAARGAAFTANRASARSLWTLFGILHDSYSRVEILSALGILGQGDFQVVSNLNRYLDDMNRSFRAGIDPDFHVLRACINTLGKLGESSSFPFLFSAINIAYPQAVIQDALTALESLTGSQKNFLVSVIRNNPLSEKAMAFRFGAYNKEYRVDERAEIAMAALEVSLADASDAFASLRYSAVSVLTELRWSPSSAMAINHFYRVQTDYTNGTIPGERLLDAITFLGATGNTEAARILALQLGYINSQAEKNGSYDEAVILGLIGALGELRDKAAFDGLMYISYLNYPDRIQTAAREALDQLRW